MYRFVLTLLAFASVIWSPAQEPAVAGLVPRAAKPITLDGKLDDWAGAFATPVHIGHPDFDNRGGCFLYLWDDDNLYIGLACLDKTPAHVAPDTQIFNGDAVEFYLDTRPLTPLPKGERGEGLGGKDFGPGTLHMFYTPFTKTEIKPRLAVRDLPAFKGFKLKGAEVAAAMTPWGWTCEFKLPWANCVGFKPAAGDVVGIDCELCSSDGGLRVDRTFVYSSPRAVATPAAFGKVRLVDKIAPADLKTLGRALLPMSLNKSTNYDWLYATVGVSRTIAGMTSKIEGKIIDAAGKVRKTFAAPAAPYRDSGLFLWRGQWEMFDLAAGTYTLEVSALDAAGKPITARKVPFLHGVPEPAPKGQQPSPMVESTRPHPRLKQDEPKGQRFKLAVGSLFIPEKLPAKGSVPLFVHFHGSPWLPEVAAAQDSRAAVIAVNLGSGSGVYSQAFADPDRFARLLKEAETRAGCSFAPVGLTAWSAGYGAVREILKVPAHYDRVRFVLLLDGLHTGYMDGKPGPLASRLETAGLDIFVKFARDAVAGKKQMIVTHTEIFPGTFASTTETADHLLQELGLRRQATLVWGPMKTQQLSEVAQGKFRLAGYAGNSAPDHVDQLHGLPEFLRWVEWN